MLDYKSITGFFLITTISESLRVRDTKHKKATEQNDSVTMAKGDIEI